MYNCSECGVVIPTIQGLCSHLVIIHSFNVFSTYKCAQDRCDRQYGSVKSFRKHLDQKHAFQNIVEPVDNLVNNPVNNPVNNVIVNERFNEINFYNHNLNEGVQNPQIVEDNRMFVDEPVTVQDLKESLFKSSLALASKLYADNTLNRTQVQEMIEHFTNYFSSGFVDIIKSKVFLMLRDTNQTEKDLNDLNVMFDSLQNVFLGLEAECLRTSALEATSCYITPLEYNIATEEKMKNIHGIPTLTHTESNGQYIPIKEVLKNFLELPNVLPSIMNNVTNLKNSRDFTNIIQSPVWQNIEEHFPNKVVLPLLVYYDDVEPNNETGSHSGNQKLGAVYYQIACLPQHLLSSVENTFAAGFFLIKDRQENNARAFAPMLTDLIDIEINGIVIQTENGEQRIFFAVSLLFGDNLGFHSITGLVESFSANFFCRFCKLHRRITQTQKREVPEELRTVVDYENGVLIDNLSETGIRSACIWNALTSFHVILNPYVDIMHDFLEGVCHYDLCAVLDEIIHFHVFFSLDTLNERVQCFNYGPDSQYRPTIITLDHIQKRKLKMNASEMFVFCRNLGLMVGDLIPKNNDSWSLYLLLNEILSIICAPSVEQNSTEYLIELIAQHHDVYLKISETTLKPKHHFMTHYPRIRTLIGPLINLWTMRTEGKHRQTIKLPAKNTTSRKNLPLTIAKKYSFNLCARLFAKRGFPTNFCTDSKEQLILNNENYLNFRHLLPDNHNNLTVLKEASFLGTSYKSGMILAINYVNDLPQFGILKLIIKPNNEIRIHFILSVLKNVGFNEHLQCYEIAPSEGWSLKSNSELISVYPIFPRTGSLMGTLI